MDETPNASGKSRKCLGETFIKANLPVFQNPVLGMKPRKDELPKEDIDTVIDVTGSRLSSKPCVTWRRGANSNPRANSKGAAPRHRSAN